MISKKEMQDIMINEFKEEPDEVRAMPKDELQAFFDMAIDTSSMHPNETLDEFLEHEDY